MTDQTATGDLLGHSKHCPDRGTVDCADMQGCVAFGHSGCDAKVSVLPFTSLFDAAALPDVLPIQLSNHYSLIPQGPPLRPPRDS